MKIETTKRLHDALTACNDLLELSSGKDYEWYRRERYGRLAAERLLEIIGEALSVAVQSSPDLKTLLPESRDAIGLRNRIVHGYDKLDDKIVWDTIHDSIPSLVNELERILDKQSPA